VQTQTLAQQMVQELNRRWRGREVDDALPPIVYEEVTLVSAPEMWPPTLRFRFNMADQPGEWQARFDFLDLASDASTAADLFGIAIENLTEWRLTGSRPESRPAGLVIQTAA
jgi:hypothetical protein